MRPVDVVEVQPAGQSGGAFLGRYRVRWSARPPLLDRAGGDSGVLRSKRGLFRSSLRRPTGTVRAEADDPVAAPKWSQQRSEMARRFGHPGGGSTIIVSGRTNAAGRPRPPTPRAEAGDPLASLRCRRQGAARPSYGLVQIFMRRPRVLL